MPLFGDWLVQLSIYYWFGFPFVARMELTAKHVYLHYEILLNKEELIKLLQCWPCPERCQQRPTTALPWEGQGCDTALGDSAMGTCQERQVPFQPDIARDFLAWPRPPPPPLFPKSVCTWWGAREFLTEQPWGHSDKFYVKLLKSSWSQLNLSLEFLASKFMVWDPKGLLHPLAGMTTVSSTERCLSAHSQHFPGRCLSWRTQNPPCYSKRITLFLM